MGNKTLSVKEEVWARLNQVKLQMQKQTDDPIHWNDTIEYILNKYEKIY